MERLPPLIYKKVHKDGIQRATPAGVRTKQSPSKERWLSIKPIFIDLYIRENLKLREVMEKLKDGYGFEATEKAFKRKIDQWETWKNLRGSDQVELARVTELALQSGQPVAYIHFRGRRVPVERINNYTARQRRLLRDGQERFLEYTRGFVIDRMSSLRPFDLEEQAPQDADFLGDMVEAMRLLSLPGWREEGWAIINCCCNSLRDLVKNDPFTVWKTIVDVVTLPRWKRHPDLRLHLYRYIRNMSLATLPEDSLFRLMIEYLTDADLFEKVIDAAISVQFDTMDARTDIAIRDRCADLSDTIESLILCERYEKARQCAQKMSEDASLPKLSQCRFNALMARILYFQDKFDQAIQHCYNMLEEMKDFDDDLEQVEVELYNLLAHCYEKCGDEDAEIKSCRSAFITSLHEWGPENGHSLFYFSELENTLLKHNRPYDHLQLRSEYPFMVSQHPSSEESFEDLVTAQTGLTSSDEAFDEAMIVDETLTSVESLDLSEDLRPPQEQVETAGQELTKDILSSNVISSMSELESRPSDGFAEQVHINEIRTPNDETLSFDWQFPN